MVKILSNREIINSPKLKLNHTNKNFKYAISDVKQKLIKSIVKKTLLELAVSLTFTAVACCFVATPAGMITLAVAAVAAVAINILLRSASAYCIYKLARLNHDNTHGVEEKKRKFQSVLKFLNYLVPMTFTGLVDTNARELLIHEGGHALATKILIKNPQTKITIQPFQGGQTSYRIGALSKIGDFFGRANSKLLIAAAGPALALGTATVSLGAALALRKSKPELSRYLTVMAVNSFAQHAFYALSALWTSAAQKGHDFVQLMAGGLHPVVAVTSIVALPIIVRLGFFVFDKIKKRLAENNRQNEKHDPNYMIQLPRKYGLNKPFRLAHTV